MTAPEGVASGGEHAVSLPEPHAQGAPLDGAPPAPRTALVVTASNRASAGVYADRGGPLIVEALAGLGCAVDGPQVVPDGYPGVQARRAGGAAANDCT
ncbi:MogA/MoaB family molybdenum cofactor biosynthesis protein, partial [Streptomyces sp. NPDC059744]